MISQMSRTDLYHALVAAEWNVRRAALTLDCHPSSLHKLLKKRGIRNLKTKTPLTRSQLELLMEQKNRCVTKVAAVTGYSKSRIFRLIRKWGIKRAERWQKWGRSNKTHCVHGHEFSKTNTYIDKKGYKICRQCGAESAIKRYYAKKEIQHGINFQAGTKIPRSERGRIHESPERQGRGDELRHHAQRSGALAEAFSDRGRSEEHDLPNGSGHLRSLVLEVDQPG